MPEFYLIVEEQVDANGNKGLIYYFEEDENVAISRVHSMISSAAISALPYHAALMISSNGFIKDGRVFDRRVPPAPPEPEPEPEEVGEGE